MSWKIVIVVSSFASHAIKHKNGGVDELKLNELGEPVAAVNFDNQPANKFRVQGLALEPSAVSARLYFNTADGHLYVYQP
jgi:hypothetical protein